MVNDTLNQPQLFPLGSVVMTPGVMEFTTDADWISMLAKHSRGDWGEVCAEDAKENDLSVKKGYRILSAYTAPSSGEKIWIITEADRRVTTLLLPHEY